MQRQIRIYLHHTDATGGIYFSALCDFHTEMAEETLHKNTDCSYPVRHVEMDFPVPIRHGDLLLQKIHIVKTGKTSITLCSSFFREDRLCATCTTVHVQVDLKKGHPICSNSEF